LFNPFITLCCHADTVQFTVYEFFSMTAQIIPFKKASLFTLEDLEILGHVTAAWVRAGLCGALLRNPVAEGERFLVISAEAEDTLWSVEKRVDGTYSLYDAAGTFVMSATTMKGALECVRLPEDGPGLSPRSRLH